MAVCYVKCPNRKCGHIFDMNKTFWWGMDENGDPTIENAYCPKCHASTRPWDRRRKIYEYDDFEIANPK